MNTLTLVFHYIKHPSRKQLCAHVQDITQQMWHQQMTQPLGTHKGVRSPCLNWHPKTFITMAGTFTTH